MMKMIRGVFAEDKLEVVQQALIHEGIQGATVYAARGFGIHHTQMEQKVSRNYSVEFQPRIVIEIVVTETDVEKVIKVLTTTAKTGRLGDGKVFVLPVEDAVRVRTGERGEAAL